MEVRAYATMIVRATTLPEKLHPPPAVRSDREPAPGTVPEAPGRPPELRIEHDPRRKRKTPPREGMADPVQRARILHALANHELQAVELFAWALLRYPTAPPGFRRGLLAILAEEQTHCRLYLERLAAHGARFGDEPVSGYFWSKARDWTTPARFVASMCLTFENANLDHSLDLAGAAAAAGDGETAAVLRRVHADEQRHVRFGWRWLARFKEPGQTMTAAYLAHVVWPLRPMLARGETFDRASRERVGLDTEFLDLLEQAVRPTALYRFQKFGGTRS